MAAVAPCDSSELSDLVALSWMGRDLSGVLHAAGAGDKGLLVELVAQRVHWMYAPKALGAWYLHSTTQTAPLEARVLFSSVGSGLGNVGQGNYAAGNACLDALALSRRAHGTATCSLQWPLVGGAGMGAAAFASIAELRIAIKGMAGILLEEYAVCLAQQLSAGRGIGGSVQMAHRAKVSELLNDLADSSQPRFSELQGEESTARVSVAAVCAVPAPASAVGGTLAEALASIAGPSARTAHVEGAVLRVVRELTGSAEAALEVETPLMEAGVDSLAATELSSRLRTLTGVALSPTIVFE